MDRKARPGSECDSDRLEPWGNRNYQWAARAEWSARLGARDAGKVRSQQEGVKGRLEEEKVNMVNGARW